MPRSILNPVRLVNMVRYRWRFRPAGRTRLAGTVETPPLDALRWLFVCGNHRSGTTLLAEQLSSLPGFSGIRGSDAPEQEGQFLQDLYPLEGRLGGIARFGEHPLARMPEANTSDRERLGRRLASCWLPYMDAGARVLVEKTPSNMVRTRWLASILPNASFLGLLRHPVCPLMTLRSRGWRRTGREPAAFLRHWVRCQEILAEDAAHLERFAAVRFEDMLADPDHVVDRVCAWLGEPRDAEARPADATPFEMDRGINDRYYAAWRELLASQPTLRAEVERSLESSVARFGYSLLEPERPAARTLPNELMA